MKDDNNSMVLIEVEFIRSHIIISNFTIGKMGEKKIKEEKNHSTFEQLKPRYHCNNNNNNNSG